MAAESWGRYPRARSQERWLHWTNASLAPVEEGGTVLPYGLGRSYGDSCLNDGGTLLHTRRLDRFLAFDEGSGVVRCEAGVTLDQILRTFVPRGWFPPVTPGTRYVTVGGALANDVHGKNHHREGTFGCHVPRFELLRSDGQRLVCSPHENAELYRATIGGLGLTGLVTWLELRLQRIPGPKMDMESVRFRDLAEFLALSGESDATHAYSVSWVDCLAKPGRGYFVRGNHADAQEDAKPAGDGVAFPFDLPSIALNTLTMRAFNAIYARKQLRRVTRARVGIEPFFYPLDGIHHWNRMYGKRGFLQWQCVVPTGDVIERIMRRIRASRQGSFLAVLKTFGDKPSPGMLSFPRPGVTLALDFPMLGARTLGLLDELDALAIDAGGAIYPAKDARMSPATFRASFPQWESFAKHVDPAFSSSFWRRITQ